MMFLKAVIFTTLSMFLVIFAFFFFTFNSEYQLKNASDLFLKGEYESSLDALGSLEGEVRSSQLVLYRAYILREQGDLKGSNEELEKALVEAKRLPKADCLSEVYLNRAFNAFLLQDVDSFSDYLQESRFELSEKSLMDFFNGLESYLNEDYDDALELWQGEYELKYLSDWMRHALGGKFTKLWRTFRTAHCRIELGEYLLGRKPLEKDHDSLFGEERIESAFLIGLSYAKEAENKPLAASMPYYQVAQSYFDQVPVHSEYFARERVRIIRQLKEAAEAFIAQKDFESVSFFVNILENWNADEELSFLSQRILALFDLEMKNDNWSSVEDLASVLNRLLKEGKIRQAVSDRFQELIGDLLEKGELSKLARYWQVSLLLSSDPKELVNSTSVEICKKVLNSISMDDENLQKALPYISYWSTIERDSQRRFLFAKQLVLIAGELWTKKGSETKGLNLMRQAESLPFLSDKGKIKKIIEEELKNIYVLAVQEDSIEKLTFLYDGAKVFQIDSFGEEERQEIANQIEDAVYLVRMGRFLEAEKRLKWVLKVNRDHQQARRLLGIVSYRQENYSDAFEMLHLLNNKDKEILEMIAVCKISMGKEKEGKEELERLSKQRLLSDRSYLELGYLSLMQGSPRESLRWMRHIRRPDGEGMACLCIAAYQEERWREALDYFQQLSKPYNKLKFLQIIAMRSFIGLDELGLAEKRLLQIMEGESLQDHLFSKRFQKLSEFLFEEEDNCILAGEFYQNHLHNYQKAIEYFNKIEDPSLEVLFCKGEAHYHLGNFKEAEWLLGEVLGGDSGRTLSDKATLMLADIYSSQHRLDLALSSYRLYFRENKEETFHRLSYVYALMEAMQWKPAVRELQELEKRRSLSDDEAVLYIFNLVSEGKEDLVRGKLKEFKSEGRNLSLLNKLKILRKICKISAPNFFKEFWRTLKHPKDMDVLEKQELMALYIELGKYVRAGNLQESIEKEMKKDVGGMMILANLYFHLLRKDESIALARKAFSIHPYNREVIEFLFVHDHDLAAISSYLSVYQKHLEEYEKHLPAEIACIRMKLKRSLEKNRQKMLVREDFISSLELLSSSLKRLIRFYEDYPEIFYLLGETLFWMDDYDGAQYALKSAVKLNPSYSSAYKLLGLSYERKGEKEKAMESYESALRYSRNDVEIWVKLANLHVELHNLPRMRKCLEQAKKFSVPGSRIYEILSGTLLEIPYPEEEELRETAQIFSRNIEALKELLNGFN